MTPRDRQRRDAAVLAEHVLGRFRSEPVDLEVFFAVEGLEGGFVDDETLEACGRCEDCLCLCLLYFILFCCR